jgi:hypothetical protein
MTSSEPGIGDLGCVSIVGDVGVLIRIGQFLTKVNWKPWTWRKLWKQARSEHVFVYVGDGQIVEAEPGGARLANLSEYADRPIVWVRCPEQYRQGVAAAARSMIGILYSAADYFALALHRFHIPAPGLRRYIQASGHEICSQLADRAAHIGGWALFDDGRWDGYVIPIDIAALAGSPA